MAVRQFYIKFSEFLTGGTAPLYISSGTLSGLSTNVYPYLKIESLSRGTQSAQTLEGTTEFPSLSFECIDPRKSSISAASDVTTLLSIFSDNREYLFTTPVELYEGTATTTYSSFTKKFSGYLTDFQRVEGGFSFECQSLFKFLENPVVFPTGSFQISSDVDWDRLSQGGGISIKNCFNVAPPPRKNLIDAKDGGSDTTAGWVDTTGTGYAAPTFNNPTIGVPYIYIADSSNMVRCVRDVAVGDGAKEAKRGCLYTFSGSFGSTFNSAGIYVDTVDSTYHYYLIVQGLDANGNVIDAERSSNYYLLSSESASSNFRRRKAVGVMYAVADPRVVTVRLILEIDTGGWTTGSGVGTTNEGFFYDPTFALSNTWLIGRELYDVLSYSEYRVSSSTNENPSGTIMVCARGGMGSLPTFHKADTEAIKVTVLCGHPLHIARRLMLSGQTPEFADFWYQINGFKKADVNTGGDTITMVNHGYQTGQAGQFISDNTLPAGLSTATDYWLIRVDDNTVKVATSLSNATSGSAIDITSQGTLTTASSEHHSFLSIPTEPGTDIIQSKGHGYQTGQKGQFTTTNTLPAGLSTATDYFIIKVDANSFKVASSLANAYAGTAVNITGYGTGRHTFVATLTETTEYAPHDGLGLGSQIRPSNVGSAWDTLASRITTGTLYVAWHSGTNYKINETVSYDSKNWRCRKDNTSVNTVAPAEGDYWEQIGNYFDGENWPHYRMCFFIQDKIENLYEWLTTNICKPLHMNIFESESSTLDARDWRSVETAGGNTLTADHRVHDGEIPFNIDRSSVINKVTYRMDFDPMGTLDIQANQEGNNSAYAREYQLTEKEMGHEDDGTVIRSVTKHGLREYVVEADGVRGAHSARFGFCYDFGGDQMAYEVARRIIQRNRDAVATYEWKGVFSKRAIDIGDAVSVTHANMIDLENGVWGRTSAVMDVLEKTVNYSDGTVDLLLRADCDVPSTITNTNVESQVGYAGATTPGTPTIAYSTTTYNTASVAITYPEFSTTTGTETDETSRNLPVYPKDATRVIWLKLSNIHAYDILVYRYFYAFSKTPDDVRGHVDNFDTAAGPPPTGNDNYVRMEYVGEIPAGSTDFYFCAVGNNAGTTYVRLRFQYRNNDRVTGPITSLSSQYSNTGAVKNYGNRGKKSEIRQVNSSGERGSTMSGVFTSYGR